jgi:hypothetical protein
MRSEPRRGRPFRQRAGAIMRRIFSTLVVMGGLVMGAAIPAAAAPPMKESGTSSTLYSYTTSCEAVKGRTVCTDIFLDAYTDTSGSSQVCVSVEQYAVGSRRSGSISSESGCTEVDPSAITVTSSLNATVSNTTVTLQSYNCDRQGECTVTGTRDVTVSASDQPVGPISSGTSRGTFTDGDCTYRYTSTSTSAEVAGTITLDGATYDEQGFADTSVYKVSTRC